MQQTWLIVERWLIDMLTDPKSSVQFDDNAGRSGLAVACLTAVCEVLGSNRAVGSCVYRTTTVIFTALGTGCVHLCCSA